MSVRQSLNHCVVSPWPVLMLGLVLASAAQAGGPSVTLVETFGSTEVVEGGGGDFYTLALGTQPSGNVTIQVLAGSQLQISSSGTLTFTTGNWNTPQQVLVEAVDDALVEGGHADLIMHTVSGGGYSGVAAPGLQVIVHDNDIAETDLAVSMQLLTQPIGPGQRIRYDIRVDNLSTVASAMTPFLAFGLPNDTDNMNWVCTASPGSVCPASGNGVLAHAVTLAPGSGLTYLVEVDLSPTVLEGTPINATVAIEANDTVDPSLANNSATRIDLVGPDRVFKDGFEF